MSLTRHQIKVQGAKARPSTAPPTSESDRQSFRTLGLAVLFYGGGIIADFSQWREVGEMLGEPPLGDASPSSETA